MTSTFTMYCYQRAINIKDVPLSQDYLARDVEQFINIM